MIAFTITAVGDISLADHLLCSGFGVKSMIEKNGYNFIFKNIISKLAGDDVVFGNLEGVLSKKDESGSLDSTLFRGNPDHIVILKDAGFNLLNIANNHTMQHGRDAFVDMTDIMRNKSINPLGIRKASGLHSRPVFFENDKKKVVFLGYSFEKDGYQDSDLPYAIGNLDNIKYDITKLRNAADIVVISCHWGLELMSKPSNSTIILARQIIDAGADMILGHHSHTIQGIERYKNKLIIYSLGNFVFDLQWDVNTRRTGIFKIVIDETNRLDYDFIPIFINDNHQPVLAQGQHIATLNEISPDISDTTTEYDNLSYYLEYNRCERMLTHHKMRFVCKNYWRMEKRALLYLVKKQLRFA